MSDPTKQKENGQMEKYRPVVRDEASSSGGSIDPAQLEAVRAKLDLDGQSSATAWSTVTMSSGPVFITTQEEFEELRRAATTVEIPSDLPRWHPNEISEWMTSVAEDETASVDDRRRAALAEAYALGIEPDDLEEPADA